MNSSKRKAVLAAEALVGIILSTIALVLLVTAFQDLLFYQHPNEQIVERTSSSLSGFVSNAQEGVFEGVGNCYSLFTIEHITSYQKDSDNKDEKYFFVITPHYVGSVPFKHLDKFRKGQLDIQEVASKDNENLFSYIEKKKRFSTPITIKLDKTKEGNTFLNEFSHGFLAKSSDQISLSQEDLEYLLLVPTFDNQKSFEVIFSLKEKEQTRRGSRPSDAASAVKDDSKKFSASYLAFSPQKNELFVPKHQVSETYIQSDLCLKKKNVAELIEDISLQEIYKLDYINYRIVFEIIPEAEYSFEWNQQPVCKKGGEQVNCEEVFSTQVKKYSTFIEQIEEYVKTLEGDVSFGVKEYIPIQEYYSEENAINEVFSLSDEVTFDNYFNYKECNSRSNNRECYSIKEEYKDIFYQRDCPIWNPWCNNKEPFIFQNNKIFYSSPLIDKNKFITFDTSHISSFQDNSGDYSYYFRGEEIKFSDVDFENEESSFEVYRSRIDFDDEKLPIYLSLGQFTQIKKNARESSNYFSINENYEVREYEGRGKLNRQKHYRDLDFSSQLDESSKVIYVSNLNKDEEEDFEKFSTLFLDEIYFFQNNNLVFYDDDISSTNFVYFLEKELGQISKLGEKRFYIANREVDFRKETFIPITIQEDRRRESSTSGTHKYYFNKRQDLEPIEIYSFKHPYSESLFIGDGRIYLSQEQYNSITEVENE